MAKLSTQTVFLFAITIFALGTAWADATFVELASPKTAIYSPITTNSTAIGKTIPMKEYPLVEETPRGYIVVLEKAPYSPPLGFIKKVNRLGNPTARYRGTAIEIHPMINEPIFPGYIPFAQSNRYAIFKRDGTNLFLVYSNRQIHSIAVVPANECTIVTIDTQRRELAQKSAEADRLKLEKEGNEIESAISTSHRQGSYSKRLQYLRGVVDKYSEHPLSTKAKQRLAVMESIGYRTVAEAIDKARLADNPRSSSAIIELALSQYPQSDLSGDAKELLQGYQSRTVSEALAEAERVVIYEEAIQILDTAIEQCPLAVNLSEAKIKRDKYKKKLATHKANTAKGLIQASDGKWLTADQYRQYLQDEEEAARRFADRIRGNTGSSGGHYGQYRTQKEAIAARNRLNANQQGYVDSARESGFSGNLGVEAHHYEVYYNQSTGTWDVY